MEPLYPSEGFSRFKALLHLFQISTSLRIYALALTEIMVENVLVHGIYLSPVDVLVISFG